MIAFKNKIQSHYRGVVVCVLVALASRFLADHYAMPAVLLALMLGLALNFLADFPPLNEGIAFCAKNVLRLGIGLLGLRITHQQALSIGWQPLLIVVIAIVVLIGVSVLLAKAFKLHPLFGFLSGGATAICGASAALAIAAALPAHPEKDKALSFTIIGVSVLSTLAMITYPVLMTAMHADARYAGIFLGGTIHDVAQVVGAGYSMSKEVGDLATIVKFIRVAMLLPVVICAALVTQRLGAKSQDTQERPPLLPGFILIFFVLAAINSFGFVSPTAQEIGGVAANTCLLIAMAAVGVKTKLAQLVTVGIRPITLLIIETIVIASLVGVLTKYLG